MTEIQLQNKTPFNNKKITTEQISFSRAQFSPFKKLKYQYLFTVRSPREYQETFASFKSLKAKAQRIFLCLLSYGYKCWQWRWCPIGRVSEATGIPYHQVRYWIRRLSELGYLRKFSYKASAFKTVTRAMLICVCTDLPKFYSAKNNSSTTNYLNPKKNNSKQVNTVRLFESSDIGHAFKNETPKDPLPIAQYHQTRNATHSEVLKLAETYGFNTKAVCKQTEKNIKGSTRVLKMDVKSWERVFAYARDNAFLNGTVSAFKATLKFVVSISTVHKINNDEYKQFPRKNQSQNLKNKSLSNQSDKNDIAPIENNSQKTSQLSAVNKVWSIMRASLIWSGKKRYEFIESQLERVGILDRVKSVGLRWENFFDKTDKKLIDNLLRTL